MADERTERLLNLVFCLMASRRAVPRAFIRDNVQGYGDSPSEDAFARMFERDKDELRAMGIPIETVMNGVEVEGYRITHEDYALENLSFTSAELSVLAVAAQVWETAARQPVAATALRKIEALDGIEIATSLSVGARTPLANPLPTIGPLLRALRKRQRVKFTYRKPSGSQAEKRHVEPWALVSWRGAWYLVARDAERDGRRVFRLSRIEGGITTVAAEDAYSIPRDEDPRTAVGSWIGDEPRRAVRVRVDDAGAGALRVRGTIDGNVVSVYCSDGLEAVPDILAAGPAAVVIDPEDVREVVIERLTTIAEAHR